MYGFLKVCFNLRVSLECIFIANPYIRSIFHHIFYLSHPFINTFVFSNPKITFIPSIKGFESLKGVWKHLLSSSHFRAHLLLFIDLLYFLHLKMPKIFLNFNIITFFLVHSTSTFHCYNLKIEFEELSIICDT